METFPATQEQEIDNAPALDDLKSRSLDISREIQHLAEGDTKVTANRILEKLNDLLDAFTPEKMDTMRGKELMGAIKESVETINILIGKKEASGGVTIQIVSATEKPVMIGVITPDRSREP